MRCRSWWRSVVSTPRPARSPRTASISCSSSSVAWRRRLSIGRGIEGAINIADLREMARGRVPGFIFEYLEGGAEDEVTLRGNRQALEALRFVPQTLVHTANRHLGARVLG